MADFPMLSHKWLFISWVAGTNLNGTCKTLVLEMPNNGENNQITRKLTGNVQINIQMVLVYRV